MICLLGLPLDQSGLLVVGREGGREGGRRVVEQKPPDACSDIKFLQRAGRWAVAAVCQGNKGSHYSHYPSLTY